MSIAQLAYSNHVIITPRLHDQTDIKQTSSNHQTNVFKIHVHDVCSNCSMFA